MINNPKMAKLLTESRSPNKKLVEALRFTIKTRLSELGISELLGKVSKVSRCAAITVKLIDNDHAPVCMTITQNLVIYHIKMVNNGSVKICSTVQLADPKSLSKENIREGRLACVKSILGTARNEEMGR